MGPVDIAVIVIVSVALLAVVGAFVYRKLIKKDKGCSCGCESCKMCSACNHEKKDKDS